MRLYEIGAGTCCLNCVPAGMAVSEMCSQIVQLSSDEFVQSGGEADHHNVSLCLFLPSPVFSFTSFALIMYYVIRDSDSLVDTCLKVCH